MRRILLVLAVAALMAVMMVMAVPAFATNNGHVTFPQEGGGPPDSTSGPHGGSYVFPDTQGGTCVYHYGGEYMNPDHASQSDTNGKKTGADGTCY